ncbi:MAG: 60S ribosomal export protein NMD3 [Desulfurococcaceae archaeon]
MRFCIRCGRSLPKEELVKGMCSECFRKHVNIITGSPEFEVTVCPRCGSWVNKGEWYPPSTEEEVLQATLESNLHRYIIEGVDLQGLLITSFDRISSNVYSVNTVLEIRVDEKTLYYEVPLKVYINHRTCPTCISRATGKYKYLVQVRFTTPRVPAKVLESIMQEVLSYVGDRFVNIKEVKEGLDLELEDAAVTRKIIDVLSKHYGAKITSSFKQTGFNTRRSKPLGVVTYSVRVPVLSEGDVVIYKNKLAYVKSAERGKIVLWIPETDKYESVNVKYYWSRLLRYPTRVEYEEYLVESVNDDGTVTLRSLTSDTRRKLRPFINIYSSLKPGSKVLLVRVDSNIEALIP